MNRMTSIKGHFDGSAVVLDEPPPRSLAAGQPVRVIVDPSPDAGTDAGAGEGEPPRSLRGVAKGTFETRDDFNDPLDEFAEYRR